MLKEAEVKDYIHFKVQSMEESILKNVYISESVKFSSVYFLIRAKIDDVNDRVFYCSVATHEEKDFTLIETVKIKVAIDKIKHEFSKLIKNE